MSNFIPQRNRSITKKFFRLFLFLVLFKPFLGHSQITIPKGSYVIDMGDLTTLVTDDATKTGGGGLRPFGMVHELIKMYHVPVYWIVRGGKAKDAIDYTIDGRDYKGGLFVISSDFITPTVQAAINQWIRTTSVAASAATNYYTRGLVKAYPIAEKYTLAGANVQKLTVAPVWTMDQDNGNLVTPIIGSAGIPYNKDRTST